MIRASALYIVIVIALVVAVICSSLIAAAYFYRLQYQKTARYSLLQSNLTSGINLLLQSPADYTEPQYISLYQQGNDSLYVMRKSWGAFQVAFVQSFIQRDTLTKIAMLANPIDSAKWSALYIADEDRSISVSGKTLIKGDAYLPKAGIREAYVNDQSYQGDKRIVIGRKLTSQRTLPPLDEQHLKRLQKMFVVDTNKRKQIPLSDSIPRSFLEPTLTVQFHKKPVTISSSLKGNMIIQSDTSVTIDNTAHLENVLIFAKSIIVKSEFSGNCQLFASDHIFIESKCVFGYPSVVGILKSDTTNRNQARIIIGNDVRINGTLFTYEKKTSEVMPIIDMGKNIQVNGRIYTQGFVGYKDGAVINGNVYTNRFLYQNNYTRFENYLINIKINSVALSRYYLTVNLLPTAQNRFEILKWIRAK